jgi:hypothetical protein
LLWQRLAKTTLSARMRDFRHPLISEFFNNIDVLLPFEIAFVDASIGRKARVGRTTGTGEIVGVQRGQGRLDVLPKQATKVPTDGRDGREADLFCTA